MKTRSAAIVRGWGENR